jgi:hypothetical protein
MRKCANENELCDCDTEVYYGEKKNGKLNHNAHYATLTASRSG